MATVIDDNREFIGEFLIESTENLDQLDKDLLALEAEPADPQRLASIFRTVHTIKGNSGFFGFSKLGALAHSGEHLLGRLRDGRLTLDDRVTGTLYSMIDAVRSILRSIEETGGEGSEDYRELSQQLTAIAAASIESEAPVEPAPEPLVSLEPQAAPEPLAAADDPPDVPGEAVAEIATESPAPLVEAAQPPLSAAGIEPVRPTAPVAGRPAPPDVDRAEPSAGSAPLTDSTVRVGVDLLTTILDLVGELVLARNHLRSIDTEDAAVLAVSQRINTVTNALQEAAVKTRMQPIEHVFSRFPRTVRDVAVTCGKEVQLTIDGADTELDRTLIEGIRGPLTHLIRNAVDHGIEPPDVRLAAGKPRAGRLSLRAFNESGRVTIEVSDDGAGIAIERVREKAIARGLVGPDEAALLSDDRVLQFIFEPGFSTAQAVTSVSGRGVGMDVVRTNIEALGGFVDIHSRPGVGTTVRVHVPLTLAIMPALIVRCAGQRFAIPQASVSECISLRVEGAGPRIEGLEDAPLLRVRGRLVPVVFLDSFLGLRPVTACRENGTVVLVRGDDREFGVVVDGMQAVGDQACRERVDGASLSTIVVKPVGSLLAAVGLYSGATVLGDGGVVLILDLRGLADAVELPPADRATRGDDEAVATAIVPERYLICRTYGGRRVAVPLDDVVRLERYRGAEVQAAGSRRLVRRGGSFTPLHDADRLLAACDAGLAFGGSGPAEAAAVNVVVVRDESGGFGIAVDTILDVVAADGALQASLIDRGVGGTVSLGGLATEVIDPRTARERVPW